jgi:hypothetical protein
MIDFRLEKSSAWACFTCGCSPGGSAAGGGSDFKYESALRDLTGVPRLARFVDVRLGYVALLVGMEDLVDHVSRLAGPSSRGRDRGGVWMGA